MRTTLIAAIMGLALFLPFAASAQTVNAQAQPPGNCELSCRNTNYASQCAAGGVLKSGSIDAQCAQSRLGIPTYTAQLTTFGNTNGCTDSSSNYSASGVEKCASGSCTSYQGQPVLGIAHRTFPFGTKIEVCSLKIQGLCAIATVVDRGPADYLQNRTIDAYSTLSAALQMHCGTIPVTYKVLSGPGFNGTAAPSGPSQVGIEAILAAQHNGSGVPLGMSYQAANTPYGYGYVGTPPPIGSAAYGALGTGIPTNNQYPNTYPQQQYSPQYQPQTYTPNTSPPVQGAGASANIVVWPHVLSKGQTLMVYWTSVNMSKDTCQVIFQGQQFAQSNEGTKPLRTTSFDSGSLTFTLECADGAGQQHQMSDSATLQ